MAKRQRPPARPSKVASCSLRDLICQVEPVEEVEMPCEAPVERFRPQMWCRCYGDGPTVSFSFGKRGRTAAFPSF